METTWKPHEVHGELSTKERNDPPDSVFAFPKQRKEPLTSLMASIAPKTPLTRPAGLGLAARRLRRYGRPAHPVLAAARTLGNSRG